MKRMMAVILCVIVFAVQMPTAQAVGTSASSVVLMEADSGRVLYEKNGAESRLIASITKLMTALVALETEPDLKRTFTVPASCVGAEGSSLYLKAGEQISLEGLLYGMLLHSGNDAALAVAELCGGSVEQFVARMNEKAQALGMKHTHFENPNGLDGETHYSSAYDMALLARACLNREELREIVSTKTIHIDGRSLKNHNKLLWNCEGCIGLKTGFTKKAGRTLVSAAERNGMTLIAVTLNDPDDWKDHAALYDWGFSEFSMVPVAETGKALAKLPVQNALIPFADVVVGESFAYPICKSDRMRLSIQWDCQTMSAPVEQGARVGTLGVYRGKEQVAAVPLVCVYAIPSAVAPEEGLLGRIRSLIL